MLPLVHWYFRWAPHQGSQLLPNAAAKPCPEGASVLSSWFSRRVAAGRSSRLSCRVLPDAKRPGEQVILQFLDNSKAL
jgi:hypothetical protein